MTEDVTSSSTTSLPPLETEEDGGNGGSTSSPTIFTWNEDAEIEYVIKEEDNPEPSSWKKEDLFQRMMHGRLLNSQIRRARHVPGILYAPAVLVGWYVCICVFPPTLRWTSSAPSCIHTQACVICRGWSYIY